MRILLVAGSPEPSSGTLVSSLAGSADFVMAVDRGADVCRSAEVRIDALCGDADTVSADALAWIREAGAGVRRFPPAKDDTDLALAFRCVRELCGIGGVARTTSGGVQTGLWDGGDFGRLDASVLAAPADGFVSEVVVTCASAGRMDHALAVFGVLADNADLAPRLVEDAFECRVLSPAGSELWSLGEDATGRHFSFVALADDTVVSETGMRWNLERFHVDALRDRGISNVIEAGDATVSCHKGILAAFLLR